MTLEMDTDDRVPLLLAGVDQHPVADEARVVDEDVQPSEGVDGLLDHRGGSLEIGNVGAVDDRFTAQRLDLLDDLVGR
jgi:hypothetical protein